MTDAFIIPTREAIGKIGCAPEIKLLLYHTEELPTVPDPACGLVHVPYIKVMMLDLDKAFELRDALTRLINLDGDNKR